MRFNVIDMDLERVFLERTLNEEIFPLVFLPNDRLIRFIVRFLLVCEICTIGKIRLSGRFLYRPLLKANKLNFLTKNIEKLVNFYFLINKTVFLINQYSYTGLLIRV